MTTSVRSRSDGPTVPPGGGPPDNAFHEEILDRLAAVSREAPATAHEARLGGPWEVRSLTKAERNRLAGGGSRGGDDPALRWVVVEAGADLATGTDGVYGVFRDRAVAHLVAAMLPAAAREARFAVGGQAKRRGYPLHRSAVFVGHLRERDETLPALLDVADALARNPRSLALLLEAVGPEALAAAGRQLARKARGERVGGS